MKNPAALDRFAILLFSAGLACACLTGCSGPSKANIELRKQNQQLNGAIQELQLRHDADVATIRALQTKGGTVEMLPQTRLADLYTVAGLKLGSMTGGYRPDPNQVGDTMVKVYVVPIDQDGDPLKTAGLFHIELFDLALGSNNRIGQWDFDLAAAHKRWFSQFLLYTYAFDCPWQTQPIDSKLLLRVTFTDALTQRVFTVDRDITAQLPTGAPPAQ